MCVQAIFWFHPLIWWMGARLLEERERACDEAVLRIGQKPRDYAEGILKVCRLFAKSPVPCVAGVTGSDLRKRIEQIMANRMALGLSLGKKLVLAAAVSAALAAPVAIGVLSAAPTHAQQQPDVNAANNPQFDAVSIHPSAPDARGGGFNIWPNRLEIKNKPSGIW
jgi:beta-lactamase regulating signal transducer with metallopeptidase domain